MVLELLQSYVTINNRNIQNRNYSFLLYLDITFLAWMKLIQQKGVKSCSCLLQFSFFPPFNKEKSISCKDLRFVVWKSKMNLVEQLKSLHFEKLVSKKHENDWILVAYQTCYRFINEILRKWSGNTLISLHQCRNMLTIKRESNLKRKYLNLSRDLLFYSQPTFWNSYTFLHCCVYFA